VSSILVEVDRRGFGKIDEEGGDHNVHGLTVADFQIGPTVGGKNATQTADTLLTLEARVLWQTTIQVLLDLVNSKRRLTLVLV
jgi:hypothetical protein